MNKEIKPWVSNEGFSSIEEYTHFLNESSSSNLSLACLGDVMIADQALVALHRMGAKSMANLIWGPLEGMDLILVNLEAPITEGFDIRENKRYNLKTSAEILDVFDKRFILGLANNHILDYGERGLLDTIEALKARKLPYAGAGRNLSEARRPATINVRGTNIGVICAADPRFQAATESSPGTFPAHPELLRESIQEVRESVELVVVSIHAGMEFLPVPSPNQVRLAELCLEEGVRVVSFHHAHCVSGIIENEQGIVFFGTGNYVFPYTIPRGFKDWNESVVWRVTLAMPTQEIEQVDIQPVFLDNDGLPVKATEKQSRRVLSKIKRYSHRIHQKKRLGWWRLREVLMPVYLWLGIVHYSDIVRRQGAWFCLKALAEGVKTQLR